MLRPLKTAEAKTDSSSKIRKSDQRTIKFETLKQVGGTADDPIRIQMGVNKSYSSKLFARFMDHQIHDVISCLVFGSPFSLIF